MASSSANVQGPPTAGVQVTEGLLAGVVPDGESSLPRALSSCTAMLAGGVNNSFGAMFELLPTMLGIGGGPIRPSEFHSPNPTNKEGAPGSPLPLGF